MLLKRYRMMGVLIFAATGFYDNANAISPGFECKDDKGVLYKIWLSTSGSRLEMVDKTESRTIPLAAANIGRTQQKGGEPLIYNGWNRAGHGMLAMLDMSTEFGIQYSTRFATEPLNRLDSALQIKHLWPSMLCIPLEFCALF